MALTFLIFEWIMEAIKAILRKVLYWGRYLCTVKRRYNEPLYNEVFGIMKDFLYPRNSKIDGKEPRYTETSLQQTNFVSPLALHLIYRGSTVLSRVFKFEYTNAPLSFTMYHIEIKQTNVLFYLAIRVCTSIDKTINLKSPRSTSFVEKWMLPCQTIKPR